MSQPRVDLVLPCLNEAQALPWVLGRVPAGVRAIVVDNGSVDGSAELARALGAVVVTAEPRGYGAACIAGVAVSSSELIAFCDCDASIDPAAVLDLAAVIDGGGADVVIARRRPVTRSAWPIAARAANWELSRRVRRASGAQLRDIGPLRLMRRSDYLALGVDDPGFGYPVQSVLAAARAGLRIAHVDVTYHPRVGASKVTGTVRGALRAVRDINAVLAAHELSYVGVPT